MTDKAFQEYYPDELSHCYGCGRLNSHGLQLKSHWEGEESVALFQPEEKHMAVPGFVYGGLIASLIDCHCTGTAAAAAYRKEGRAMDTDPGIRFVTASLHVDYLAPTPIESLLEIRGIVVETTPKKTVIEARVMAGKKVCAKGKVVAVHLPESMLKKIKGDH
jgi:acyl-coenzyme A thioesterase PaaI-like protein